jgi:hypothetical protein
MNNETRDRNIRSWIFILGILLIVALVGLGVIYTVREIAQGIEDRSNQALGPINDMSNAVGTQVAQVLHPTPTVVPDPVTIIREVRALARLETIQYTVEKVITAESGQGIFRTLFGDKLLLVAHGVVVAGIDMQKLQPEDLRVENGVLYVTLPDPEIFIATLDNQKSYVYDRQTGLLTHGDVNLETTARAAAEKEIEKAAVEDGILEQARTNGENYLYSLFTSLGYKEVIFEDRAGNQLEAPTELPTISPTPTP